MYSRTFFFLLSAEKTPADRKANGMQKTVWAMMMDGQPEEHARKAVLLLGPSSCGKSYCYKNNLVQTLTGMFIPSILRYTEKTLICLRLERCA